MIEDKELGLKIAENKYEEIRERLKTSIKDQEVELELNNVLLEYLNNKCKKKN